MFRGPVTRFIVGTGRCGTLTLAELYGGRHESHIELTVELACRRSAGLCTDEQAAALLAGWCQFGEVDLVRA